MNKKMFAQVMRALTNIKDNMKLTEYIHKEKKVHPRYQDLFSLETIVQKMKVECKKKYYCGACDTKKRNKCWSIANRVQARKTLIKNLPYKREELGAMKIAHLWILCSHLQVTPTRRSRSEVVEALMRKQYRLAQEGKKVKGKEKASNVGSTHTPPA